jgi:hypothetical protein
MAGDVNTTSQIGKAHATEGWMYGSKIIIFGAIRSPRLRKTARIGKVIPNCGNRGGIEQARKFEK